MGAGDYVIFAFFAVFGFASIVCLWVITFLENHELLGMLKDRERTKTLAVFPEAFAVETSWRKTWFFFSADAKELMSQDPELRKRRRRCVRLTVICYTVPWIFMLVVILLAWLYHPRV